MVEGLCDILCIRAICNSGHVLHMLKIIGHSGHNVVETGDDMRDGAGGQNAMDNGYTVCNTLESLALQRKKVDIFDNLSWRIMSHSDGCESNGSEVAEGDHFDDWNWWLVVVVDWCM